MKPGSTDGILTVFASLLVSALLFIAQHFTSAPRTTPHTPPDENLAEASTNAQADTSWFGQRREVATAEASNSRRPANPFDTQFGRSSSDTTSDQRSTSTAPNKLPSFPSSSNRTAQTSSKGTTRTFGPSTSSTNATNRSQTADERPASSSAATFKVVSIIDGDTIDLLVNRQPVRLRLNGIDTPEKGQPFGNAAKDALAKAIGGQNVQYVVRDTDRYNRAIADVYFRGVHINKWLIQKGLAWHYKAYNKDPELALAEQQAAAASRGLWADPRRVAPWNWRKLSKLERDEYR